MSSNDTNMTNAANAVNKEASMNESQRNRLNSGISNWGPLPYEVVNSAGLYKGWVEAIVSRPSRRGVVVRYVVHLQPNGAPHVVGVK